jgi:5-formyltetrahydrofolate cyclo-ligase
LTTAAADKTAWRTTLVQHRATLPPDQSARASLLAARYLVRSVDLSGDPVVSAFWSLEGEIDTRPVLLALHALGVPTALPRMQGRGRSLRFHLWSPGDPLEAGPFQVQQPLPEAPPVAPAIMLTPLLAFDRQGYRLGWGGGFYDRTIAERRAEPLPLTVIGYAFACQEVDQVPIEPFDQRLDMVVTEQDIHVFD